MAYELQLMEVIDLPTIAVNPVIPFTSLPFPYVPIYPLLVPPPIPQSLQPTS